MEILVKDSERTYEQLYNFHMLCRLHIRTGKWVSNKYFQISAGLALILFAVMMFVFEPFTVGVSIILTSIWLLSAWSLYNYSDYYFQILSNNYAKRMVKKYALESDTVNEETIFCDDYCRLVGTSPLTVYTIKYTEIDSVKITNGIIALVVDTMLHGVFINSDDMPELIAFLELKEKEGYFVLSDLRDSNDVNRMLLYEK